MFIDNQWKKEKKVKTGDDPGSPQSHRSTIFLFLGFAVFLILVIIGVFWGIKNFSSTPPQPQPDSASSTSDNNSGSGLPEYEDRRNNGINDPRFASTSVEAEKLNFGDFYERPSYDYSMATSSIGYELPIQVKTQVSNFYDVDRKIDLDEQVSNLNNNGFAIISNPFSNQANDFYSMYRKLEDEGIPMVITKDFLNYYYQYVLKDNFKEIEGSMFYNNLWNINKTLYERAKLRYEKLLESEGLSKDPYVQGARLEMAYFAVTLKLLEPEENQLSGSQLDSEGKFSEEEAVKFSVELPYYLKDDVPQEVDLILDSEKMEAKSPVLFYRRNYRQFRIPQNYQNNARLKNVYLASNWLNSLLPLYHRDSDCPDCGVDKADWRIEMVAAMLMAHDFNQEQSVKNDWAQIYKIVSYFNGLRDELTYLQYVWELQDILGEDYDLKESFFNKELQELDDKLYFLREKLVSDFVFTGIEGAHDHTATSGRPHIGLRVLSQPYVPNEYIYKQLVYPNVGKLTGQKGNLLRTVCKKENQPQRCRAISLDIPNLIHPISSDNEYFNINTNYQNYDPQVDFLRKQLDRFDEYAWHESNYWNIFYNYDNAYKNVNPENPMFSTDSWGKRNIEFLQGSLALTQLSTDKLQLYKEGDQLGDAGATGGMDRAEVYNHIEPNLVIVREMRSDLKMVRKMLENLEIFEEISSVESNLKEAQRNFEKLEDLLEKQLTGEELNKEDVKFFKEFVTRYKVIDSRRKELNHDYALKEKIEGVKLLALVYKKGERKILGLGPIFNYQEKR